LGNLADAHLSFLERHHHPQPVLIRQRFCDIQEVFHLLAQFANGRNMQQPPAPVKPKTRFLSYSPLSSPGTVWTPARRIRACEDQCDH
jgi:hypothetical protein